MDNAGNVENIAGVVNDIHLEVEDVDAREEEVVNDMNGLVDPGKPENAAGVVNDIHSEVERLSEDRDDIMNMEVESKEDIIEFIEHEYWNAGFLLDDYVDEADQITESDKNFFSSIHMKVCKMIKLIDEDESILDDMNNDFVLDDLYAFLESLIDSDKYVDVIEKYTIYSYRLLIDFYFDVCIKFSGDHLQDCYKLDCDTNASSKFIKYLRPRQKIDLVKQLFLHLQGSVTYNYEDNRKFLTNVVNVDGDPISFDPKSFDAISFDPIGSDSVIPVDSICRDNNLEDGDLKDNNKMGESYCVYFSKEQISELRKLYNL